MVFPYRKPPLAQDYCSQTMGVLPGVKSLPRPESLDTAASVPAGVSNSNLSSSVLVFDDQNKKIRKPYTITKSRENWTDIEHDKFLEALHLFDRDWKKIEAFIGSKTAIQIRSHAQKYFLKVQKSGTNEHVPPPRPKRKASHPYPHKAPKTAIPKSRATLQSSADLLVPGDVIVNDSFSWPANPCSTALSSWTHNTIAPATVPTQDDMRSSGPATSGNCCSSSIESGPGMWPTDETNNQQEVKKRNTGRVMPDFAKVYRFIGSVFDPNASDHLQKLKMMDPVDVETAVLLMKNLCGNLKSPQFEGYRRLFSSYDANTEKIISGSSFLKALPGSAIASS